MRRKLASVSRSFIVCCAVFGSSWSAPAWGQSPADASAPSGRDRGNVTAEKKGVENVVVTVSPMTSPQTLNASDVDPAQIESMRSATSDTAGLLKSIPGVTLQGAGGVSSLPVIHGMADDRVLVKVDGMDLIASCPNHMNPPMSYVDPTNVGMIQVFAGVTPVSVGGDSIGGTIVVETSNPLFAAPGQGHLLTGEAGAFYRSNGKAIGANLAATAATESVSVTYTGAIAKSDNYEAGETFKAFTATGRPGHELARDEVGSTAYETRNHALGLAWRSAGHLVEAKLGYQDMPEQLYPNQRMDLLDNTQKRGSLRYLGDLSWGALEARAYYEKVEHFMDFGDDKLFWYGSNAVNGAPCSPIRFSGDPLGTCAAGMPMYTESTTTGVSVKADVQLSERDLLRVGGELQRYRLDDWWTASGGGMGPDTFWNIHDGERDRTALFGEWEGRFSPRWLTVLGARFERVKTDAGSAFGYRRTPPPPMVPGNQVAEADAFNARSHDETDDNWDLTALGRYSWSENLDVELGLARKVRSPNLYQRYTWSTWAMAATMNNFLGDGNGYVGDIGLQPEKAHTVSVTIDWHAQDRSWEVKATPYYTRVTDYIDAVRITNNVDQFNVLRFVNQSARLYGLDLSGRAKLGTTGIGELGIEAVLTYTNGENRDTHDGLYNVNPLHGRLAFTHEAGGWKNRIELEFADDKEDVSDVRNEIETPGYGLVHVRSSYGWKQVRLDFGVENLFDRKYQLPLGGAYMGQGRTMSLNGIPWGIAVPGPGRSFYVGLNVKF
jgi:iron complex outermembrane receptor protein